jgi:flavodoxin
LNAHHRFASLSDAPGSEWGGSVQIAIVFDSRTGTTKAAAEEMATMAVAAGHEPTSVAVQAASPADLSSADAVCIGSWTEGLFFIRQHATQATMEFIDNLSLDGVPAAVFCTYKTSPGKMLDKMAGALEARGAHVTGRFRSRGRQAPDGFSSWLESLEEG